MSIGYACLTVTVPDTALKSCTMKNATEEKLRDLISHNLAALKQMLVYNANHDIRMFRISSDIIPFGSSPVNTLNWQQAFESHFAELGRIIREADIRVSMHPGQYTVINSPDPDVVRRAVLDLIYHADFLDCLGTGPSSKIILHVGGIYGDKRSAMSRFIAAYRGLPEAVLARLVIENDDKSYTIEDVLELSEVLAVPVVYDNLHNAVKPSDPLVTDAEWVRRCRATWRPQDGRQKIHYSQQNPLKQAGSHSETIALGTFLAFYEHINGQNLDIMLEVKDKNCSAVKCINALSKSRQIKHLEAEWSRYKYAVLERSPSDYQKIRELLKDKHAYPVLPFYEIIERALETTPDAGQQLNAAMHVWGYFRGIADERETRQVLSGLKKAEQDAAMFAAVKRKLFRLAEKYKQTYLVQSAYFYL